MSAILRKSSLKQLLRVLEGRPLAAFKRCQEGFHESELAHNAALYEFLAFLVEYVRRLTQPPHDLSEFMTELRRQGGPTNGIQESRLPLLVVKLMMGVRRSTGPRYEQARIYGLIVNHFVSISVHCEDIPTAIENKNGIYNFLDEYYPKRSSSEEFEEIETGLPSQSKSINDDGVSISGNADADSREEDADDYQKTDDDTDLKKRDGGAGGEVKLPKLNDNPDQPTNATLRKNFNPQEDLSINAGRWLSYILKFQAGAEFWIQIRTLPNETSWNRFEMVDLDNR